MARAKYKHESFESATEQGKFTKICGDMMRSPAWKSLNLRQQGLYLYLKAKYTARKSAGRLISDNRDDIAIPRSEWVNLYGDYRTFRADIERLKAVGLIRLIQSGRTNRTCNIYGFSAEWKQWGS